jgi:hypothetical protein
MMRLARPQAFERSPSDEIDSVWMTLVAARQPITAQRGERMVRVFRVLFGCGVFFLRFHPR